jgi:hypothetical protein
MHSHSIIVFSLAAEGLIHDMHSHSINVFSLAAEGLIHDMHSHSIIVFSLAAEGLIHEMHSHSVIVSVPAAGALIHDMHSRSIIVFINAAEGSTHDMHSIIVSVFATHDMPILLINSIIVPTFAAEGLVHDMQTLHTLNDVSAPIHVSMPKLFMHVYHNLADKFVLLAESLNKSPTMPSTTAITIAKSFLMPEEVVSCLLTGCIRGTQSDQVQGVLV